jgi:hypothetical protein
MPNGTVIAFHVGILLWFSRLDVIKLDTSAQQRSVLLIFSGLLSQRILPGLSRHSMI